MAAVQLGGVHIEWIAFQFSAIGSLGLQIEHAARLQETRRPLRLDTSIRRTRVRTDLINLIGKSPLSPMIFDDSIRLYVIGDIHGRIDLLDSVIQAIHVDVAHLRGRAVTVTLGDYVDRGPKSRQVLDRLAINPFPTPYIGLKGNHEDLLAGFLADPRTGEQWRSIGGVETLDSFAPELADLMCSGHYDLAAEHLARTLTTRQTDFLANLRTSVTVGGYFLCHAGVRPGIPLREQSERDLMWIRREFLDSTADFGKIVVHGHTPVRQPEVLPNRINIDTGAFSTGRLTCLVLENGRHRFLT